MCVCMCACLNACVWLYLRVCKCRCRTRAEVRVFLSQLSTYSSRCGFTIEPKPYWRSRSIRLACTCRRGGWVLICCLPNSRVTDRFPCPSDTYMGAKDLISGPSPVFMLGLTGVFTVSHFPSTSCLVWYFETRSCCGAFTGAPRLTLWIWLASDLGWSSYLCLASSGMASVSHHIQFNRWWFSESIALKPGSIHNPFPEKLR